MSFDESNQESNQEHLHSNANGDGINDENEITDFEVIEADEVSAVENSDGFRVRTDYFYSPEAVKKMERNLEILLECEAGNVVSLDQALCQFDEKGLLKRCVEKHGAAAVGAFMRNSEFQVSDSQLENFWL